MKIRKPTVEQAYNRIVKHFSQPNAKLAIRRRDFGYSACEYYKSPGVRCAVGCLLTDEQAKEAQKTLDDWGNGSNVKELLEYYEPVKHWGKDEYLALFLARAQEIHDTARSVPDFLNRLERYKP